MNIAEIATSRRTAKAFDPDRKLPPEIVEQIETLLRFSPSSVNSQPWHYVIASSDEGKARVAKATVGGYAFNEPKVRNASHVVVFCTRANIDEQHLETLLAQEAGDGRFASDEARAAQQRGRSYFVGMHRFEKRDAQHWMEKQVYLALGTLLLGAGALGIDACPIEGFDQAVLDAEFDLRAKGYTSAVLVALGYRGADDLNATLPKSRLPESTVISRV